MLAKIYNWVDERANLDGLNRVLLKRHTPASTNWWFTFGSTALFLMILQVITGSLLAMNYVPSAEASASSIVVGPDGFPAPVSQAYASVNYIMTGVPFGGFLRNMHYWGATLIVIVLLLHIGRIFAMGAYKYPRELNWLAGVVILIIVMAFGLTGYLLPWDQRSYWATVVAVNIAGSVPLIGPYLHSVIAGGTSVGPVTLTRFYAVHTLILPGIVFALIGIHLYLVILNGVQGMPGRLDAAYEQEQKSRT